jgi:hypothetical protein
MTKEACNLEYLKENLNKELPLKVPKMISLMNKEETLQDDHRRKK